MFGGELREEVGPGAGKKELGGLVQNRCPAQAQGENGPSQPTKIRPGQHPQGEPPDHRSGGGLGEGQGQRVPHVALLGVQKGQHRPVKKEPFPFVDVLGQPYKPQQAQEQKGQQP